MRAAQGHVPELGAAVWVKAQNFGCIYDNDRFLSAIPMCAPSGSQGPVEAVGYMRTSSITNVGEAKDSDRRQRAAIEAYAKRAGMTVVDWFYDPAVSGADHHTNS